MKDRLEWFLLLDKGRPKQARDRHYLFLYSAYRLQNCCRHEEVRVEWRGLEWKCKNFLESMIGKVGKGKVQEILRDILGVNRGRGLAAGGRRGGSSWGSGTRKEPDTERCRFRSGGDIENPAAYFS